MTDAPDSQGLLQASPLIGHNGAGAECYVGEDGRERLIYSL